MDFFNQHRVQLDFGHNVIKTNTEAIASVEPRVYSPLKTNKSIKLSANSVKKIPLYLPNNKNMLVLSNTDALTDILIQQDHKDTILMPVCNRQDTPVTLSKNTTIAYLEYTEDIDRVDNDEFDPTETIAVLEEPEELKFKIGENASSSTELHTLLHEFQDIFSKDSKDIGLVADFDCSIEILPNALPIRSRPYPLNPNLRAIQEEEIKKLLDLGKIRASTSIFSCPVIFVKKKKLQPTAKQEYRMVIDYRLLNKICKRMYFQLPKLEDIKFLIAEKIPNFFSKLDIKSAFLTLPLIEQSRLFTAFTLSTGESYEYTRLPFGYLNSPFFLVRVFI